MFHIFHEKKREFTRFESLPFYVPCHFHLFKTYDC